MNKNTIIYTIIGVILIIGFLFLAYNLTSTPEKNVVYKETQTLTSSDHIKWSPDKKNLLVEYSDLQCPACKAYHDVIKSQIETASSGAEITKKITFVYRHFPLSQHQYAQPAAYAAEAAGKQGKFYEMIDLIFEAQDSWSKSSNPNEEFVKMAQKLNLDMDKFKKDFDSQEVKNKVNQDYQSGIQAQVRSTPSFYLNGQKLDKVSSFDDFIKLLKEVK
ncbi:MAG: thioredoxin domain-containing protein [Candidatus Roizmanbacteria bacterium]|nr:MAG: thioredoxin domain-containing protein [Candidatus Roizmanbacteria bacterium]